jgi:hypothetical protein
MKFADEKQASQRNRALRTQSGLHDWGVSVCVLVPLFYLLTWTAHPVAHAYWAGLLSRTIGWLGDGLQLERIDYQGQWIHMTLLSANVVSREPGPALLAVTTLACIAGIWASYYRKDRWLPLAYLLRVSCITQLAVCAYFWLAPGSFPYNPRLHLRDLFVLLVGAIVSTPLVMAMFYYPLDFSLAQKALATALTLGYLVIAAPFVMLLHIIVIHHGSLLFMPFCYFVLGVPLIVGLLVTVYAYCASWRGALTL